MAEIAKNAEVGTGTVYSIIMQSFIALGLWSVSAILMDDALQIDEIYASTFVYLPAMWIAVGLAALFIGRVQKEDKKDREVVLYYL